MRTLFQSGRKLTLAVVVLFVTSAVAALADGCFIPSKVYLQPPTIPAQTAILSFRDGQETLVVQSMLNAEGQEFGWIIPVPATPTKMQVGSPGMIKTLQLLLQPKILADPWFDGFGALVIISAWVTYWGIRTIYHRPGEKISFVSVLIFVGILTLLSGLSLPACAYKLFNPITSGITLENNQTIGHYDVATLRTTSPKALNDWLEANQLRPLNARAQAIVAGYIREGWVFVTARLHRDRGGLSAPHPLVLTFPAKEPVYPMRLTALTGAPVHLELFIVGDRQYQSRDLRMQFSDQFFPETTKDRDEFSWTQYRSLTYSRVAIGHAAAQSLLWPGCIITKLVGDVGPEAMQFDYRFLPISEGSAYQQVLYSKPGAIVYSLALGLGFWCIGLIVTVRLYLRIINEGASRLFLSKALMILVGYCVVLVVGDYLSKETVAVRYVREARLFSIRHNMEMREVALQSLTSNPNGKRAAIATEMETLFREIKQTNPYLGGNTAQEDSPGNFEVLEREGKPFVRCYREDGSFFEVGRPEAEKK